MKKVNLKIKTLTPIWTGDSDAKPSGLKMSGIMGGMRTIFESIIRLNGGHTCDITGRNSCNHEKSKDLCPACTIFGCTGYSRLFKIKLELPIVTNMRFPASDTNSDLVNRDHNENKIYGKKTEIDLWLGSMFGARFVKNRSIEELSKLKVSYSDTPVDFTVLQMRKSEYDITAILTYLINFMSDCHGLGAKVNQGWGFFNTIAISEEIIEKGDQEIERLVANSHFSKNRLDQDHAEADDFFAYDYELPKYEQKNNRGKVIDSIGFEWDRRTDALNFIPLGFALQYRLRRDIKFSKENVNRKWGKNYKNVPWRNSGEFANALFGNAMRGAKKAGYVGVSHIFKEADIWKVRLIGKIPKNIKDGEDFDIDDFLIERMRDLLKGGM